MSNYYLIETYLTTYPLPRNFAGLVAATFDSFAFSDQYQTRISKPSPSYMTLYRMLKAVEASEQMFQQFEVNVKAVANLAKDIFINQGWLMRDPTIASVADPEKHEVTNYIVGGRHRVFAIVTAYAHVAVWLAKNSEQYKERTAQDVFEEALLTPVRYDEIDLSNTDDLLALITSDNTSRTMRRAESMHLQVQMLGGKATSTTTVADVVVGNELSPAQAKALIAQMFVRQTSPLKPQTRQVLGEKVGAYIMYGVMPTERLSSKAEPKITDKQLLVDLMQKAWDILVELLSADDVQVVARNATTLASAVCDKLVTDQQEATVVQQEKRRRGRPRKQQPVVEDTASEPVVELSVC